MVLLLYWISTHRHIEILLRFSCFLFNCVTANICLCRGIDSSSRKNLMFCKIGQCLEWSVIQDSSWILRLASVRILAPNHKGSRRRTKDRRANNETTAIWSLAWEVGGCKSLMFFIASNRRVRGSENISEMRLCSHWTRLLGLRWLLQARLTFVSGYLHR